MNIWTKEDQQKLEEVKKACDALADRQSAYTVELDKVLADHRLLRLGLINDVDIASLRKALEPFDPSLAEKAPADDGWITWTGGECPTEASTKILVKLRSGEVEDGSAGDYRWDHLGACIDIVAFKILRTTPAASPDPAPADDGWTTWAGGECPVDGPVWVKRRDAAVTMVMRGAELPWWRHRGDGADIIAYRPELAAASTEAPTDGWATWAGGECPVPGHTLVDVKLRDGSLRSNLRADTLRWEYCEPYRSWDIIAYRVIGQ